MMLSLGYVGTKRKSRRTLTLYLSNKLVALVINKLVWNVHPITMTLSNFQTNLELGMAAEILKLAKGVPSYRSSRFHRKSNPSDKNIRSCHRHTVGWQMLRGAITVTR